MWKPKKLILYQNQIYAVIHVKLDPIYYKKWTYDQPDASFGNIHIYFLKNIENV